MSSVPSNAGGCSRSASPSFQGTVIHPMGPSTSILAPSLVLIFLVSTTSAFAQEEVAEVEPYLFETYEGDTVHAELGRLRVPLQHRHSDGDSLTLVFVRFPATVPDPGPPLVYLAGGPGGSGIATARGSRFSLFMAFRRFGDVIAFDQRGTGMSDGPAPEECEISRQYPRSRPLYADHQRQLIHEVARECGRMWRKQGVDLSVYNTRESADDLADLAAVLGHEKLRLWAISYGTHLGLATIRRHPDLIERAILAGVEGPDHTVKLPSYWTRQIEELEKLVSRDSAASRQFPDLTSTMATVLRGLDRDPAPVEFISADFRDTVRSSVTRFEVASETIDRLRDPETMVTVPYLYRRMVAGDFSLVADADRGIGGLAAMSEAMDAASGISENRLFRFFREDRVHLLGGGDELANAYMADALGVPGLGPAFREPVRSEIPALFVSGTLDGRTPPGNAEEVLRGFPNGRHLVIENAGHSDPLFLSSPRIQDVMAAFLGGEPLPTLQIRVPPPELRSGRLPASLPTKLVDQVVGAYERSEGDVWRIVRQGTVRSLDASGREMDRHTELFVRIRGNGFPFAANADTMFGIPFFGPGLTFRFPRDSAGQVRRMELIRVGGDTTRFRKVDWEEVGFVDSRRWFVAGPFHSTGDSLCNPAFEPEGDALKGRLDLDDRYATTRGHVRWLPAEGDDGFVNLEETLGGSPAGGVGYGYIAILTPAPVEAQMRTGTDDDARIFLNGEKIYSFDGARAAWEEQDVVPVSFQEGRNRLLVKLCNRDSDWRFNLRITDAWGRSLVTSGRRGQIEVRSP